MPLTIVSVAYPIAPVRADCVGGAEQIVQLIDRGLVARGFHSIVVACSGSSVSGELVETPRPTGHLTAEVRARAIAHHRTALDTVLSTRPVDVVHFHGHDFDAYLPRPGVPVLATVHLPSELMVTQLGEIRRVATWVHGVSRAQHARLPRLPTLLPPIENGIAIQELPRSLRRRPFTLALGRICPEKGFHLALDAARRARVPLLIGGTVFPYEEHQRYFAREVMPRLDRDRRFVGPLSTSARRRLLNSARCVLIPSLVAETSSLVAMEALACGTPVIAFASGALPETVEHGVTGFIVRTVEEMADAIARVDDIEPEFCRATARVRFSSERMVAQYVERYRWMLLQKTNRTVQPHSCRLSA
jgi:glycosyltransferase involved in cell wall biosynthesis